MPKPLDPKTTKNGVDLNTVDTSQMALVDKKGLIDELKAKLSEQIEDSFKKGIDTLRDEIADLADEFEETVSQAQKRASKQQQNTQTPPQASGTQTGTQQTGSQQTGTQSGAGTSPPSGSPPPGGSGTPPTTPPRPSSARPQSARPPKQKAPLSPEDEFRRLQKAEAKAREMVDKAIAFQKKADKDKHAKFLKENVYSAKGKGYAEDIDELAEGYQNFDRKELERAKKRLADIEEGVKFGTYGQENDLLTKKTANLAAVLAAESKKRSTAIGKIGGFLNEENINATSIIAAMTGNSPMVGLMTKGVLETVKHFREKSQKKKAEKLKVGDIRQKLPRPNEPGETMQLDDDAVTKALGSGKEDYDAVHKGLEDLYAQKRISKDQYDKFKTKLLPTGFVPGKQQTQTQAPPAAQTQAPPTAQTQQQAPPAQQQPGTQQPGTQTPQAEPPEPVAAEPEKEPAPVIDIGEYEDRRPERVPDELRESLKTSLNWERRQERGKPTAKDHLDEMFEREQQTRLEGLQEQRVRALMKKDSLGKAPAEAPKDTSERGDWVPEFGKEPNEHEKVERELSDLERDIARVESILKQIASQKAEREDNLKKLHEGNVVEFKKPEEPAEVPVAEAPEQVEAEPMIPQERVAKAMPEAQYEEAEGKFQDKGPEKGPVRVPRDEGGLITILKDIHKVDSDTNSEIKAMAVKSDQGFSKLIAINQEQLNQMKSVNKEEGSVLKEEQTLDKEGQGRDLANELSGNAKLRETPELVKSGEGVGNLAAKATKKSGGGLLEGLMSLFFEGIGGFLLEVLGLKTAFGALKGVIGGVKGMFGDLIKGGKNFFSKLFGGGKTASTAAEGAEAAEGAGAAAEGGAAAAEGGAAAAAEGGAVAAEGGAVAAGAAEGGAAAAGAAGAAEGAGAAAATGVGVGAVATTGAVVLGGLAAGYGIARAAEKVIDYGDVIPGVKVLDYTRRAAMWLKENGIDAERKWYQPMKMWMWSVRDKWGDLDKKKPGAWQQWLRKTDPGMAFKMWGESEESKKDKEERKKTQAPTTPDGKTAPMPPANAPKQTPAETTPQPDQKGTGPVSTPPVAGERPEVVTQPVTTTEKAPEVKSTASPVISTLVDQAGNVAPTPEAVTAKKTQQDEQEQLIAALGKVTDQLQILNDNLKDREEKEEKQEKTEEKTLSGVTGALARAFRPAPKPTTTVTKQQGTQPEPVANGGGGAPTAAPEIVSSPPAVPPIQGRMRQDAGTPAATSRHPSRISGRMTTTGADNGNSGGGSSGAFKEPSGAAVPGNMKVSDAMIEKIKKHESFLGEAYPDPPGSGLYSIGYGHQIKEGEMALRRGSIDEAKATQILRNDTSTTASFINNRVKVPLTQDQFDVLVDFGHSGLGFLQKIIETLNTGDYEAAAKRMSLYNKAVINGKLQVLPNLVSRRKQEVAQFLGTQPQSPEKVSSSQPMLADKGKGKPPEPGKQKQEPTQLASLTSAASQRGKQLTAVSTEQSDLQRSATLTQAPANLYAPSTVNNNNKSTTVMTPRAQNDETTYQRAMNSQYVAT